VSNVIKGNFNTKFVKNAELAEKIYDVIGEYSDQISLAELIGILEIVKLEVVTTHLECEE
jgi:hypothetical protein